MPGRTRKIHAGISPTYPLNFTGSRSAQSSFEALVTKQSNTFKTGTFRWECQ